MNYFSIEGNEGSGKSVLSKKLAEKMGAVLTYEPNGETEILKTLRSQALTQNPEMTDMGRELLLLANRSIHNHNFIKPLIESNKIIITDRSFFSGLVYAKANDIPFFRWMSLYALSCIEYLPDTLIYITSNKRKIEKEVDNIYDHASDELLSKIDLSYKEGLEFIKQQPTFKNLKVIEFFNDFNISIDENVELLYKILSQN